LELLADSGTFAQQKLALLLDEASQLIAILTSIAKKGPSTPVIISSFIAHPFFFL